MARLVSQGAGYPLYLEELIRTYAQGNGDTPAEIILALLVARIVRLDAATRRVLRGASLFGTTFCLGGLTALYSTSLSEAELRSHLAILVEAEIIEPHHQSRFPGETEYVFAHCLMRDAAYSTWTEPDQALGHRLVASYLEQRGESDASVVADHLQRGGERGRAVLYYLRAAEQSYERLDSTQTLRRVAQAIACGAVGEALQRLRDLENAAQARLLAKLPAG